GDGPPTLAAVGRVRGLHGETAGDDRAGGGRDPDEPAEAVGDAAGARGALVGVHREARIVAGQLAAAGEENLGARAARRGRIALDRDVRDAKDLDAAEARGAARESDVGVHLTVAGEPVDQDRAARPDLDAGVGVIRLARADGRAGVVAVAAVLRDAEMPRG